MMALIVDVFGWTGIVLTMWLLAAWAFDGVRRWSLERLGCYLWTGRWW